MKHPIYRNTLKGKTIDIAHTRASVDEFGEPVRELFGLTFTDGTFILITPIKIKGAKYSNAVTARYEDLQEVAA